MQDEDIPVGELLFLDNTKFKDNEFVMDRLTMYAIETKKDFMQVGHVYGNESLTWKRIFNDRKWYAKRMERIQKRERGFQSFAHMNSTLNPYVIA